MRLIHVCISCVDVIGYIAGHRHFHLREEYWLLRTWRTASTGTAQSQGGISALRDMERERITDMLLGSILSMNGRLWLAIVRGS